MTTLTSPPQELQSLIDMRLDLVDRVLQDARLSRAERTGILQELEGQIQEQLDRRSSEPTREDVLAVLAELDPPEAFLDTLERGDDRPRPMVSRGATTRSASTASSSSSPVLAIWAGSLVGGVALLTAMLMTACVWFLPYAVLIGVGVIQLASFVGSGLGLFNLIGSRSHRVTRLERTVSIAAAATAPLALLLVAMMIAIFAETGVEGDMLICVLAGFVGGAWMHGAWLCAATLALLQRR